MNWNTRLECVVLSAASRAYYRAIQRGATPRDAGREAKSAEAEKRLELARAFPQKGKK